LASHLYSIGFIIWDGPHATITWPTNNEKITDNTIGVRGTAKNVPNDSDLWLFLRSGVEGRWYPIKRLRVTNGKWFIGRKWICPVVGVQELIVYLIPDSEEGQLFAYQNSGAETQGVGLNSIPPYATVEATAYVEIPRSAHIGC
jgi:hypothetical protein